MQLQLNTTQNDIKVEVKEEVMDINEDQPLEDYVQESTTFKADLPEMDGVFHHGPTQSQDADFMALCSSVKSTAFPSNGKVRERMVQKKKIYAITPPQTFTPGWCTTKRAQLIVQFLENFAKISQSSKDSWSAHYNIASNCPRFLQCEKCSRLFSGLHDRFLKIFLHYKTCHKETCNILIGQKWVKHQSTVQLMMKAWQRDLLYIRKHKVM